MITALPPLLLAAALGVWPAHAARRRLRTLAVNRATTQARRLPKAAGVAPFAVAALAWWALGPAGALAGLLLAVFVRSAVRRARAGRRNVAALDALAESLRSLVAELRAGANPVAAAESAADEAPPDVAAVLRTAAVAARLGGEPDVPDTRAAAQIVRAWRLATQHGLPLADVLDSVRGDLEQRARFARQVEARMAGPRASAVVLAVLPVLALLLGQAAGAQPLAVLTDTVAGQLLLLLGVTLVAAGLRWAEHLTQVGAP